MNKEQYIAQADALYTDDGWPKNNITDTDISGNAWITQCVDFITRWDAKIISKDDIDLFTYNLDEHRLRLGHWWRLGKIGDQQAHDDIMAIVTVLLILKDGGAKDPGIYGYLNNYVYEYKEKDWWWPIFGPTDYFRTVYMGKWWFSYLRMWIGVLTTSLKDPAATSGRQLDWLMCRGLMELGEHDHIVELFKKSIMNRYPGGMGDVFAIYYRNPEHCFAQAYYGKMYL